MHKFELLGILLAAVLVILIYANSLNGDFVFDDENNIKENAYIRLTSLSLAAVSSAGLDSPHPRRLVAYISFAFNYYFHRYDTFGYRLINVLIHITAGIFIYFLVKITLGLPALRYRYSHPREIAFFVTLIWLVHPLATQSVAYVVQRMNSLSAMFYVLSLLLYVKGRLAAAKGKRWTFLSLCAISGILALGSKEIAVTLPAFIVLYEWYFLQDLSRTWLKRRLFLLLGAVAALAVITIAFLGPSPLDRILGGYDYREFTLSERVMTQFRVVVYYITLIVFPHPSRLSLDREFPLSYSLIDPVTTLLSLGAIAGIFGIACVTAWRARLISFCLLWYLGNLAIESSIIPLEIIFEHRTYLPSIGIILPAVLLLYRYVHLRWVPAVVLGIVVLSFAVWTNQRSGAWGHSVELYRDVVQKYPGIARGHANLGTYLQRQGNTKEAIFHLSEAIRLQPNHPQAHGSLGKALFDANRQEEAIAHLRESIRIQPSAPALSNLGGVLVIRKQYQEAAEHLSEALRLDPHIAQTHYNLGVALSNLDRKDEAMAHYREAIRIDPAYADAHDNLGVILSREGRFEEALEEFSAAVRANPNHANAQAHLGIALLQQGRAQEAVVHLREALRLQPDHPDAVRYLAHALQRAGGHPKKE